MKHQDDKLEKENEIGVSSNSEDNSVSDDKFNDIVNDITNELKGSDVIKNDSGEVRVKHIDDLKDIDESKYNSVKITYVRLKRLLTVSIIVYALNIVGVYLWNWSSTLTLLATLLIGIGMISLSGACKKYLYTTNKDGGSVILSISKKSYDIISWKVDTRLITSICFILGALEVIVINSVSNNGLTVSIICSIIGLVLISIWFKVAFNGFRSGFMWKYTIKDEG